VHLEGFKGILQVDGYAGYPKLVASGDIELAFCWVHKRRRFYELAIAGPAPIASEALKHIAQFYAIGKTSVAAAPRSAVSCGNRKADRSPMHSRNGSAKNST
jgi:hypothetical protein